MVGQSSMVDVESSNLVAKVWEEIVFQNATMI